MDTTTTRAGRRHGWVFLVVVPLLVPLLLAAVPASVRQVYAALWRAVVVERVPCLLSIAVPASESESCLSWTRRESAGPSFHLAAGLVLVGGSDRRLHALSGVDGSLVYTVELPGSLQARPTLAEDAAYFGTDGAHVMRVDVGDGHTRWDVAVDAEVTEPAVVAGDLVLVTTGLDSVYALRRDDGAAVWVHKHPLPRGITLRGQARPLIATVATASGAASRVFIGHADGKLDVVDPATGQQLDEIDLSGGDSFGDLAADPFLAQGRVVVASQSRGIFALDPATGKPAWKINEPGIVRLSPGSAAIGVAAGGGKVIGFDVRSGVILWRFSYDKGAPTRIVVDKGRVHVASDRGALHILDLLTGQPLQAIGSGQGFAADVDRVADMLFAVTTAGSLIAYSDSFPGRFSSSFAAERRRDGHLSVP